MPPNNPMTEGEALAVDAIDMALRAWFGDETGAGLDGGPEHAEWRRRMQAALAAHTAASGGEVACHRWWRNGELVDSDWTNGPPSERQIEAQRQCRDIADWTVEYAYRAPPAAVPADALERLVAADLEYDEAERGLSRNSDGPLTKRMARFNAAQKRRDELLAALIPKGADHGG